MTGTTSPGLSKSLILLYVICLISNIFGGMTSTLMSVYLPSAVKDLLGTDDPTRLNEVSAYVSAVFIFGWTAGGIGWGLLSDSVGRSLSLGLSIVCFGLFTLLTAFTDSWQMVMICRFLTGFGAGGVLVLTPTMLSERWPAPTRAIVIGILSIGFPIGIFSAGAIDLFVKEWHDAFLVGLLPLALGIISLVGIKDRPEDRASKEGATQQRMTTGENLRNIIIGSTTFGTMLIGLWAIFSWMPTWLQSIVPSDNTEARGLSMMILGAGGLLGGFFSGWLSNAIGYRKAMLLCFVFCFAMSVLLFRVHETFSTIMYIEIAVLSVFFGASQGILSAFVPELFPDSIKATATGFCFNIGRVVTGFAVFFVGFLVTALGGYGNAIFTFSFVFLIGLIATLLSKEANRANSPS